MGGSRYSSRAQPESLSDEAGGRPVAVPQGGGSSGWGHAGLGRDMSCGERGEELGETRSTVGRRGLAGPRRGHQRDLETLCWMSTEVQGLWGGRSLLGKGEKQTHTEVLAGLGLCLLSGRHRRKDGVGVKLHKGVFVHLGVCAQPGRGFGKPRCLFAHPQQEIFPGCPQPCADPMADPCFSDLSPSGAVGGGRGLAQFSGK